MHNQRSIHLSTRFLFFALLLFFCLGFGVQTKAATVSMNDVSSAASGTFVQSGNRYLYRYSNGSYAKKCLLEIDDQIYYFSTNGYRQYGWKEIEDTFYYFGKRTEGFLYRNQWVKSNSFYYYVGEDGARMTGWLTVKGKKYYLNEDGQMQSGWLFVNRKKYYMGTASEGWMYTSTLLTYKKRIFYLQKNGTPATGWKTISGNRYYFDSSGHAYTGKHTFDDTDYYFASNGILLYKGANLSVTSDCAILINASTGEVLYERNADTRHANASTTKIMTCILALENTSLSDRVTVSANAAAQEPTKLGMKQGDSFRMKYLLYSLMLPSHNDTAVAIAEHISGTTTKFASLMNQKAAAIGCTDTHFVTPNGLDAGLNHYTTARDLAKIAQYAQKSSVFRQIVSTSSYRFRSFGGTVYRVETTDELLGNVAGVTGMKTGYTNKAGYCFVGSVKNPDGTTYISVTLGASTSLERWNDSKKLLAYAYQL